MKLSDLQSKLLAVARRDTPSDHAPYAFEKRIMSHLGQRPVHNPWALWSGPLWRAAVCCMALTLLCGFWSYHTDTQRQPEREAAVASSTDLSDDLAMTVFAPMDQPSDDTW